MRFKTFAIASFTSLAFASAAYADVQLTIQDGQVSLVAKDATLRQILAEWAKVGQTKIVNSERVPGGPVTLEFTNLPEDRALDVLLHSISGYMAAPRAIPIANASRFDRIIVMPTSVAPRAAVAGAPPAFPQPGVQQPFVPPQVQTDDDVDDEDRPAPNVPVPPTRGPVFNTFPQPQVVNPQQQGVPAQVPGVVGTVPQVNPAGGPAVYPPQTAPGAQPASPAGGVAVPGMIVQPPQPTPGQPGQVPQQPGQVMQPGQPIPQRPPGVP